MTASVYQILRRPIITEKTSYQANKLNQYVFEVDREASAGQIKDAVEKIFDVTVVDVRVINVPPKRKRIWRNRRMAQRRTAYKKAIVTLVEGDSIPAFEGVK